MRVFNVSKNNRLYKSSTSRGNQMKWVIRDRTGKVLYLKANQFGYEGISEALVSEFFGYVRGISYVDYSLCEIIEDGVVYRGCYSENMLSEDESLVSLYRVLLSGGVDVYDVFKRFSGRELVDYICMLIEGITGCSIKSYLKVLFGLDWITLNDDRHLNNISLIKSKDGYRPSPIFDNGLSLCSDFNLYPIDMRLAVCMRKVKAKPFSSSFKKQYGYIEGSPIVIDYDYFIKDLSACTVEYNNDWFLRAKAVLKSNLKALEGIVWVRS